MIPENIRKIDRPKNTIVQATKHDNVFLVVQRIGCKYDKGRRIPVNGKVIGHIIDGKYVKKNDKEKKLNTRDISLLKYGAVAFCDMCGKDILSELENVYHKEDAKNIYLIALLRSAFTDIKDYQLQDKYEKSWASILYSKGTLSKNTVSKLIENIGKSYDLIIKFMKKRCEAVIKEGTKILIDGMLKTNNSSINSFSSFSYKGKIKGAKDISIICAIDSEKKEPICLKVYPGHLPDHSNTIDFVEEFSINNGLLITDKGFPLEKSFENDKTGFIHPIKRNATAPYELGLYDSLVPMTAVDGTILGAKGKSIIKKTKETKTTYYYYLFKDIDRAIVEEKCFISNKNNFDMEKYKKMKERFGTICFISNMDLDIMKVYEYYRLRWEIENVFKMYKNILELNTTREHDDWSIIGSEFINFLSVTITSRMKNTIVLKGLDKTFTYKDILERLNDVIKTSTDGISWKLCSLNKKDTLLLEKLGV